MVTTSFLIQDFNKGNPYSDYGKVALDERFVGREREMRIMHQRLLTRNVGSLSLIGLPRIGKTSLIYQVIINNADRLRKEKILIHYCDFGSIDNSGQSFKIYIKNLMKKMIRTLTELAVDGELTGKLEEYLTEYLQDDEQDAIRDFFELLHRSGYRCIAIIDEFDYAKESLRPYQFQFLRHVASTPNFGFILCTVSRKSLKEIEPSSGIGSDFSNIFEPLYITPFSQNDVSSYWDLFAREGIETSSTYQMQIHHLSGGHPHIMNMLNSIVYRSVCETDQDGLELLQTVESELKLSLTQHYENTLDVLHQEGLMRHLIQILVGPLVDTKEIHRLKLVNYGIIREMKTTNEDGNEVTLYSSFSEHFKRYLTLKSHIDFEYWQIWSKTEEVLRELITIVLNKRYGNPWEDNYLKEKPNKLKRIEELIELRSSYKNDFGERAPDNLLHYTYPMDLWNLFISDLWNLFFHHFFPGKISEWKDRIEKLAKFRNPFAHNNGRILTDEQVNSAKQICELVVEEIESKKELVSNYLKAIKEFK
jgi:hypothetical protein